MSLFLLINPLRLNTYCDPGLEYGDSIAFRFSRFIGGRETAGIRLALGTGLPG